MFVDVIGWLVFNTIACMHTPTHARFSDGSGVKRVHTRAAPDRERFVCVTAPSGDGVAIVRPRGLCGKGDTRVPAAQIGFHTLPTCRWINSMFVCVCVCK